MPVIIDDFEVVTTPPETPDAPGAEPSAEPEAASPAQLSPQDVQAMMRHHQERMARLYAQ